MGGTRPLDVAAYHDQLLVGASRVISTTRWSGGVRAENVQKLATATGAVEFHTSLRATRRSPLKYQVLNVHLGDAGVGDYAGSVVGSADLRMLRAAMNSATLSR